MSRVKYTMDFVIKSSPKILYDFLSTPEGLVTWFADHVDSIDANFSFFWDGYEEKAVVLDKMENEYIRFKMLDSDDGEYLQFKIEKSPVTGDTILIITDFCDDDEVDDQQILWKSQILALTGRVGGAN